MTNFSAQAAMVDALSHGVTPSTNPEKDMALRAQIDARSGGIGAWLRQTAFGKALAARKAERDLDVAVARLSELSPHLLADIGILETSEITDDLSIPARAEVSAAEIRAATVPVALRPAQRPAIITPARIKTAVAVKPQAAAAHTDRPSAQ